MPEIISSLNCNSNEGAPAQKADPGPSSSSELFWLWLCSCPLMSRSTITALIRYFGSPEEIYNAPESAFSPWKKLGNNTISKWLRSLLKYKADTDPAGAAAYLRENGISFVSRYHPDYPGKLLSLADLPYGLFYIGHLPDPGLPAAAVVGARSCSNYGYQMAGLIGRTLAEENCQLISGMAMGIDGAAQSACAAAGGKSFALLGCGVDVCYPKEHLKLYDRLPEHGGILSEYAPGSPPMKQHFPERNRLISGLSDAVVVIEARARSGSLITADFALDQGKDIYAVPGRCSDPLSYGCNRLIEQGACIVLSADNLMDNLAVSLGLKRPEENKNRAEKQKKTDLTDKKNVSHRQEEDAKKIPGSASRKDRAEAELSAPGAMAEKGLSREESSVLALLSCDSASAEEIAARASMPLVLALQTLVSLQLKGYAEEVSKNRYSIVL